MCLSLKYSILFLTHGTQLGSPLNLYPYLRSGSQDESQPLWRGRQWRAGGDQNNIGSFDMYMRSNMALAKVGEERECLLQESSQIPRVWSRGG